MEIEKFEDTTGIFRSGKSNKDRQLKWPKEKCKKDQQ
jgi:hypothetical protein